MAISIKSVLKRTILVLSITTIGLSGTNLIADAPFHPFAESLDVDPDYQMFASVDMQELEELSARKRANKGWFVSYDKLHFGMDRPDTGGQSSKIDMTSGNRWDFGFMSQKNRGWLFSFMNVGGPNVYNDVRHPRTLQPDIDEELFPALRPRYPYDPNFGDGTILERQSVNVATFSSFEANKTWRLEPYRYGGILEPLIGFRYMQFNDYAVNDRFFTISAIPAGSTTAITLDAFNRQTTRTDNRMITGQLGYRYSSTISRMTFSQESRFFAGQNFQTQGYETRTFAYQSANAQPDFLTPTSAFAGRDNSETVVGFDARMEAAMQMTKAFGVRAGVQVLYIGRGIWRGANPGLGDQNVVSQDMISPAFTFGAAFNR
ncbi:MAG: hypothetical protein SGI77_25190 [Pirellulaceae bacterium]|nr:hypothetical protein [Pirellulaceae bacterium]